MEKEFLELVRGRRAIRGFKADPVPDLILGRVLEAARWAPSGYNLQPTRWVVVRRPELRSKLHRACLGQRQILEAPVTVVFVGDADAWKDYSAKVLAHDIQSGAISRDYAKHLEKWVKIAFDPGPAGIAGWIKHWGAAFVGNFRPVARLPLSDPRGWMAKQAMLSAMNFLLACEAEGIAAVPMEGFDERRVKKVLGIPSRHGVFLVAAAGYESDRPQAKSRRPLSETVFYDGWPDATTRTVNTPEV